VTTVSVTDGRSARSAKTRDSIADALLDLIGDGNLRPTAKEIAEAAGVSVRSVYVHFDDLEDLFCVAAQRQYARVQPMLEPVSTTGTLQERAVGLVSRRARLYAKIGAVARATELQAPFSPTLARLVRDGHARSVAEIERAFAAELDTLSQPHRTTLVATLDVLTGLDAWEVLRRAHELNVDAAVDAVSTAIVAQIEAAV
jgi:AcrR family transcriptional regulator